MCHKYEQNPLRRTKNFEVVEVVLSVRLNQKERTVSNDGRKRGLKQFYDYKDFLNRGNNLDKYFRFHYPY